MQGASTSSMRQMRAEREMPAARQSAETPAVAARPQLRTRTPVPSAHRSTCVASVRHSSRGKCTLYGGPGAKSGRDPKQTACRQQVDRGCAFTLSACSE